MCVDSCDSLLTALYREPYARRWTYADRLGRFVCLALLLAACARVSPPPIGDGSTLEQSVYSLTDLIEDLRVLGLTVVPTDRPVDHGFAIKGVRVWVEDVPVFAYEFADATAARTAAAGVSTDEYSVTIVRTEGAVAYETHGDWLETPHVYRKGRLIAITGGDPRTLEALDAVLGPPLASGTPR